MIYSSGNSELMAASVMLNGIRSEIDTRIKEEMALDKCIFDQMQQAALVPSSGFKSTRGFSVTLCLNKVQRLRVKRERVNTAIALLEARAADIEGQLAEARRWTMMLNLSDLQEQDDSSYFCIEEEWQEEESEFDLVEQSSFFLREVSFVANPSDDGIDDDISLF